MGLSCTSSSTAESTPRPPTPTRPRSPTAGPQAEPRVPPSPEPTGSGQGQRATSRRPSQPSPHPSPLTPHTTHSSFTLAVFMTSPPAPALPSTTACWPSATATTTGSSRTPGAPDGERQATSRCQRISRTSAASLPWPATPRLKLFCLSISLQYYISSLFPFFRKKYILPS